ncbi:MAG: site-2 protease family protein [Candidatus Nealsonbacteria bacterium]|nr:site-2 protease family protein [Candidatus Nealsonbacteria bacterium]
MLEIIIIVITFSLLIISHELGHFLMAKKFGVKVEEFGLGLPPRVFGRKIGETIFSLNAIPFGGFIKMYGEEENIKNQRSFTSKPVWQRALIIVAGCVAFWIIAAILFSIVFGIGIRTWVTDAEYNDRLINPQVQILPAAPDFLTIAPGSPAQAAGLKPGDIIKSLRFQDLEIKVDKVGQVQDFTRAHQGQEIILTIQRGEEFFDVSLIPRISPPEGEGAMGVALVRTAEKSFPWWQASIKGAETTINLTYTIIVIAGQVLRDLVQGQALAPEVQLAGPVGIFSLIGDKVQLGIVYFLKFIAIIAIHLAIINLLPIPALDGGKLIFLGIEGVRGKPIPQKIEQGITAVSFFLLIGLMLYITIFIDIPRLAY